MAAAYGFVYLLSHPDMPGVYKIGFTDRAPRARVAELSASTSIPREFEIVCYMEVEDALGVERRLHAIWSQFRISPNREFFDISQGALLRLIGYFSAYPGQLGFCDVGVTPLLHAHGWDWSDVPNVWSEKGEPAPDAKLAVVGGTEAEAA